MTISPIHNHGKSAKRARSFSPFFLCCWPIAVDCLAALLDSESSLMGVAFDEEAEVSVGRSARCVFLC